MLLVNHKIEGKSAAGIKWYCERLNSDHFISRLSMIVWVNVVLNRTVVLTVTDILTTCAVVIFRVKVMVLNSGY